MNLNMYRYKLLFIITYKKISALLNNVAILFKGQSRQGHILMISHRLEKGLCISNPRLLWGWEKAEELTALMAGEVDDSFAKETGLAVLHAFLSHKKTSNNEVEIRRLKRFELQHKGILNLDYDPTKGGTILLSKKELMCNIQIEELLKSRHSIRDFAETDVPVEKIVKAAELANYCPSACNRQPSHVYIIPDNLWRQFTNDPNQVYNANKHLLITARKSDFALSEIEDWVVSASIYAAYLTLCLTSEGIGSCVIKKGLIDDKHYQELKKYCSIPKDEKIILEIAVGNYKESFKVPVSNRKSVNDLITIIQ